MATPLFSSPRVLTFLLAAWLAWLAMHTATLYWLGFNLQVSVIDAAVNNGLLILCSVAVSNTLR